jgi:ABC-type transporter Mla subunit MlaD
MNRRVRDSLVGFFVLAGVVLAVWAFLWFSGRVERGRRRVLEVYFPSVSGLRVGDPVEVLGILKGKVARLELADGRVKATVALEADVPLPDDTKFAIRSMSYLGSDRYLLVTPGNGPELGTSRFSGVNEALDLEETFLKLDRVLAAVDVDKVTGELRQAKDDLMKALNSSLAGLSSDFSVTAQHIVNISAHVDTLSALVSADSPAGKALQSAELYDELRRTNSDLQALIADIRANPERYVKVRFSLFGRN